MSNSGLFKTELSDDEATDGFILDTYPFADRALAGLQTAVCAQRALPDGSYLMKFADGTIQRHAWQNDMIVELNA